MSSGAVFGRVHGNCVGMKWVFGNVKSHMPTAKALGRGLLHFLWPPSPFEVSTNHRFIPVLATTQYVRPRAEAERRVADQG